MILDSLLRLSDSEDISQAAGDKYSTSVLNTSTVLGDLGAGETIYAIFCIDAAVTSAGSAGTVVFAIIDEADTTLDGSSVVICQTAPLVVTRLTLGKIIVLPIPTGLITQQYIGAKYTIATETTTAGTVSTFIGVGPQTWNVG